jgi:hypothetical protein
MMPSCASLRDFGNTSSASTWYTWAYIEATAGVNKGETVLQVGVGGGMKSGVAYWRALRTVRDRHPCWEHLGGVALKEADLPRPISTEYKVRRCACRTLGGAWLVCLAGLPWLNAPAPDSCAHAGLWRPVTLRRPQGVFDLPAQAGAQQQQQQQQHSKHEEKAQVGLALRGRGLCCHAALLRRMRCCCCCCCCSHHALSVCRLVCPCTQAAPLQRSVSKTDAAETIRLHAEAARAEMVTAA